MQQKVTLIGRQLNIVVNAICALFAIINYVLVKNVEFTYLVGSIQIVAVCFRGALSIHKPKMIGIFILFHILFLNSYMLWASLGFVEIDVMRKFATHFTVNKDFLTLCSLICIINVSILVLVLEKNYAHDICYRKNIFQEHKTSSKVILTILLILVSINALDIYLKIKSFYNFDSYEDRYTTGLQGLGFIGGLSYHLLQMSMFVYINLSKVDKKIFTVIVIYLLSNSLIGSLLFHRASIVYTSIMMYYFYTVIYGKRLSRFYIYMGLAALLSVALGAVIWRGSTLIDPDIIVKILFYGFFSQSDMFLTVSYGLQQVAQGNIPQLSLLFDYHNLFLNVTGVSVEQSQMYLEKTVASHHLLTASYSKTAYLEGKGLGTSYIIQLASLVTNYMLPIASSLYVFFIANILARIEFSKSRLSLSLIVLLYPWFVTIPRGYVIPGPHQLSYFILGLIMIFFLKQIFRRV